MAPIDPNTALEFATGTITGTIAIVTAIKKLLGRHRKHKEEYRQSILKQAKEEVEKFKTELEEKIKKLENEFELQKASVSKDFDHFRETHNAEIKILGEKIENLRQDISQQHQALVGLLTRLVDSR